MRKILVVEDNEVNRNMLKRRLERRGFEVVTAPDGAQGMAVATAEAPDLIVMDLSLPVLNGWDATRRLKASAATQSIPIIALTAHAMSGDRGKALAAGCDDYDTKPIEWPRLMAKLDALLRQGAPSPDEPVQSLAAAPASQAEPAAAVAVDAAPSGHVLVVDDNVANRELLSRRLLGQGHTVATAENGRQALEMLQRQPFDLVLLDIMMPEVDGYQVLEQLKADARLCHIPVIMISALGEIASVARCIEMGADDYLPKPFNPVLLKARVDACLEKKRLRDREVQLYEQLQENYRRLQDSESLRDSLTSMIVHDLRTPLTSFLAGLQTIELLGELNHRQQEFLGIAISGGHTLLGMINDLLDISKLESGSLLLDCQPLAVTEVVQCALHQVTSLAEQKSLKVTSDIAADLPPLHADEVKLGRTLVNLLGNAVKFTPMDGAVTISVRGHEGSASEDGLLFAISDTGAGIPAEAFERIFEKFGQVETRQAGHAASTGLGLTFCKMVVEAHGGRIWVESEPGRGSTFSFIIPVRP
jgi:CheY-like chemotaxis protein